MKKVFICAFVFCAIMNVSAEIFTTDDLEFLLPLPDNPSLVGYSNELKESMLPNIKSGEDFRGVADVNFRINASEENSGFIIGGGLGLPIRLGPVSLFIPFYGGTTFMFNTMGEFLDDDTIRKLPPQGMFLSGGLFISHRYGYLGFMYDWFNVGGDNRFIQGKYSVRQIYAQTNVSEIPYLGTFLALIDGYFSIDRLLESFSTNTGLNDFKSEYSVRMLLREIPLGKKAGLSFAAFSQKSWYDMYSKYDMQGGKIYLGLGNDNFASILFADIANRKFFDVIIAPRYAIYKDGIYMKTGAVFLSKGDGLSGYLQLYAESGKEPLFTALKFGVLFGFNALDFAQIKVAGDYIPSIRNSEWLPVNGAIRMKMRY